MKKCFILELFGTMGSEDEKFVGPLAQNTINPLNKKRALHLYRACSDDNDHFMFMNQISVEYRTFLLMQDFSLIKEIHYQPYIPDNTIIASSPPHRPPHAHSISENAS